MTSFNEREKAFENKYKHDQELQFKVEARRNKLLGLWAAELRKFERISAVTVRGRIRPNSKHNFRMSVGPVNLIFNWEMAQQCHFRYDDDVTVIRRNLLEPGREHEITVRQLTAKSIEVLVDGRRVWITLGRLWGTVTIYPYQSSIGIRGVRVLGKSTGRLDRTTDRPSHRRW